MPKSEKATAKHDIAKGIRQGRGGKVKVRKEGRRHNSSWSTQTWKLMLP